MDKSRADFELCAKNKIGRIYRSSEPGYADQYEDSHTQIAWEFWQVSRKQALEEARLACEKLGDHEQDMGREKEAFGCDLCCDAIRSLEGNATRATCSCEACMPQGNGFDTPMRMILCATCGNKRCPHATDHRNACTGSNEPGQKGSSWENYTLPGNATKETT